MPFSTDRRSLLASAAALFGSSLSPDVGLAAQNLRMAPPQPFSFDILKDMARERAAQPYEPPRRPAPEIVAQIDYDAWGKIRFDPDRAVYADGPERFPVTFFH